MTLPLILGFMGLMFLWGAVKNETPWSQVQQAFGGTKTENPGTPPPGPPKGELPGGGGPPPPPPPPGNGDGRTPTAMANLYRRMMEQQFPQLRWVGTVCCRKIGESGCSNRTHPPGTWSQHAWGNAVDFVPWGVPGSLDFIRNGSAAVNWAKVHIPCIRNMLWQVPGHYGHFHADFNPQGLGTPPCAGGQLRWDRPC